MGRKAPEPQQVSISEKAWHLDRRVPIAIILTLIFNTVAVAWWASAMAEKVANLERRTRDFVEQNVKIVRLETQMTNILEALNELRSMLRNELKERR